MRGRVTLLERDRELKELKELNEANTNIIDNEKSVNCNCVDKNLMYY